MTHPITPSAPVDRASFDVSARTDRTHSVVVLAGDGIGPEVTAAAVRVLEAVAELDGTLTFVYAHLAAGFEEFQSSGDALPEAVVSAAKNADATLVGAIDVAKFPAGTTDTLSALRRSLDASVSIRPAKSLDGVDIPAGQIDTVVVREVTEGLYSGIEYRVGPDDACAVRVVTREASLRAAHVAFAQAAERRGRVTVVHKRGVLPLSDGVFLDAAAEAAREYPGVTLDTANVDACAAEMIRNPSEYDVVLASNAFGDILSDVAATLAGGIGLAASGCVSESHSYFEPIHGTAPDIAGKGVANPIATILSAALMLGHLGEHAAAGRVQQAVEEVLSARTVRTVDLGGRSGTAEMTDAIIGQMMRRAGGCRTDGAELRGD